MSEYINRAKDRVRAGQPYLYRKAGLESEVYQVRFHNQVNGKNLNQALEQAMIRFPYFKVRFLEENSDFYSVPNELPLRAIETDTLLPLGGRENNFYMMGITYDKNVVNVSFHHGLTDGEGIKSFVESLIFYYCRFEYHNMDQIEGIKTSDQDVPISEYVDPFQNKRTRKQMEKEGLLAYDESTKRSNQKGKLKLSSLTRKAYTLPATKLPPVKHRRYEISFSQKEFMALCKKYNATPVILLSVLMSRGIAKVHPENRKTINSNFPVDIRNIVGAAHTYKNCVKSISLPYGEGEKNLSTEELCAYYKQLLNTQRSRKHCLSELGKIVMLLDVLKIFHSFKGKQKILKFLENLKLDTYLISYVGQFNLGSNEQYIDSIHLFSSCSDGLVMNMTCECGYFQIDFIQDFEEDRYFTALLDQLKQENIMVKATEKIEYRTPCDTLMKEDATYESLCSKSKNKSKNKLQPALNMEE